MVIRYLHLKTKRAVRTRHKIGKRKFRLSVFRSNKYISAQIIDDLKGETLVAASLHDIKKINSDKKSKTEQAFLVGQDLAEKAIKKGIKSLVFDRRGYKYHGRIKALADGAREKGLVF